MKNNIYAFLFFMGLFVVTMAISWDIIVYFQNWNIVLTDYNRLLVFWKPTLLLIIGATMTVISIKKI